MATEKLLLGIVRWFRGEALRFNLMADDFERMLIERKNDMLCACGSGLKAASVAPVGDGILRTVCEKCTGTDCSPEVSPEVAMKEFCEGLDELRKEEEAYVTLFSDNPEGEGSNNNAVVVQAPWTGEFPSEFRAETLYAAVRKAVDAKRAWLKKESPPEEPGLASAENVDGVTAPERTEAEGPGTSGGNGSLGSAAASPDQPPEETASPESSSPG